MVFSRNAESARVEKVMGCLPVWVVERHEKYLELPTEMGNQRGKFLGG